MKKEASKLAFLKMSNITKTFPGVIANDNVSLELEQGEILALLGENGAGKTTLMNILYGLYHADEGEISIEGINVEFSSPGQAIEAGIGMVHQHFMLIQPMTVLQNIILGLKQEGNPFIDYKKTALYIEELSKRYGLHVDVNKKVSELSLGEEQRVEILKALYREAKILIFDEPTAVLTPQETEEFFTILKRLKEEKHAVIIITHRMTEIMKVSDKVTILRDGKYITTVKTSETNPHDLSYSMIGREIDNNVNMGSYDENKEVVLNVENLYIKKRTENLLENINFKVHKGEILGVAGVDGNGQRELAEAITGIRKCDEGEIIFKDLNIKKKSIMERYESGISYVPDDRHKDGLVLDMDISENLIMRTYKKQPLSKNGFFNKKAIREIARKLIGNHNIKTPEISTKAKLLSGGNQQKIILARELQGNPELVVVSQPTRGLDVGATENVRELLIKMREDDKSVLLISADLEEVLALSDRIAVMYDGKILGILKNDDNLDLKELGALMAGHLEEVKK
jgi:simple sugar transport system ATP-binding protein